MQGRCGHRVKSADDRIHYSPYFYEFYHCRFFRLFDYNFFLCYRKDLHLLTIFSIVTVLNALNIILFFKHFFLRFINKYIFLFFIHFILHNTKYLCIYYSMKIFPNRTDFKSGNETNPHALTYLCKKTIIR